MKEFASYQKVYNFADIVFNPIAKHFFHYTFDSLENVPRPFLLLSNHNTDIDPLFVGITTKRHPMYFVASDHILNHKFLGWFMKFHCNPIFHEKGKAGMKSVVEIMRRLKGGMNVCLFPEGNRSFNGQTMEMSSGTGKLAKKCGCTVVTFRMEGGYLTTPRWGKGIRRGQMHGKLVNVYSPEQLKSMTDEEVNEAITQDIFEDAYLTQSRVRALFRGGKRAEYLESLLFACPKCGAFSTLSSKGNRIICSACHYKAEFKESGELNEAEGLSVTIPALDIQQRAKLSEVFTRILPEIPLFNDAVTVLLLEQHKVVKKLGGILTAFKDRFTFENLFALPEDIEGAAIYSRNVLTVHLTNGKNLEVRGSKRFNAYKYLKLFNLMKESAQAANE